MVGDMRLKDAWLIREKISVLEAICLEDCSHRLNQKGTEAGAAPCKLKEGFKTENFK
jgi:hypothetical protein